MPHFQKQIEQTEMTDNVRVSGKQQDDRNESRRKREGAWEEVQKVNKNGGNKKSAAFPSERRFPWKKDVLSRCLLRAA